MTLIGYDEETGRLALCIEDADGEVWTYSLDPADASPGWRRYEVEKQELDQEGTANDVHDVLTDGKVWRCSCKAFTYNRDMPKTCKHVLAVQSAVVIHEMLSEVFLDLVRA